MGSSRPENLATESRTICRPKKDRDMNQLTSCWTYSYDGNNNSQVLAYEDIYLQSRQEERCAQKTNWSYKGIKLK